MRYLLSGAALAALIVAGLPAWGDTKAPDQAQPAATTSSPTASSPSSGTSSSAAGKARAHMGKSAAAHKRRVRSPEDNMAEELNRQELARVTEAAAGRTSAGSGSTQMPSDKTNAAPASRGASESGK